MNLSKKIPYLLLLVADTLLAQGNNEHAGNPIIIQAHPYGMVTEIHSEIKDENHIPIFLNESPMNGVITLYNGEKIETKFNYDLRSHSFEYQSNASLRRLSGKMVKKFSILNGSGMRDFRNSLQAKGLYFLGFIEQLEEGAYSLYQHETFKVIESNYVAALDAGRESDIILRKSIFYLEKKGEFQAIPTSKKKLVQLLQNELPSLENILNEKKYNLKKRNDLVTLFQRINLQDRR